MSRSDSCPLAALGRRRLTKQRQDTLNLKRALRAELALDAYRSEEGLAAFDETVTDLLADLGHLCDLRQHHFLPLLKRAIGHWLADHEEPDGMGGHYAISITVDHSP